MAAFDEDEIFGSNDDDIIGAKPDHNHPNVRAHVIPISGKGIPGYLAQALTRYVQEHPESGLGSSFQDDQRGSRIVPLHVTLFNELSVVTSEIYDKSMRMPSYRAVLHVLNTMTEGHLQRVTAVFEMERSILAMHECIFTMNTLYMQLTGSQRTPTTESVPLMNIVAVYLEIAMFCLEDLKQRYQTACDYAGMEPNKSLMDFGMVEFADFPFAHSFSSFHNVQSHFIMGDIQPMMDVVQKLGDLMAISFDELIHTSGEPLTQNDQSTDTSS